MVVPSAGTIVLTHGALPTFTAWLPSSIATFDAAQAAAGVHYRQSPVTTAAAVAVHTTVSAQNSTGSGATVGGNLVLSSGSGATHGNIRLQRGGTDAVVITSAPASLVANEVFDWNASGTYKLAAFTGIDLCTGSSLTARLSILDASLTWATSSGHGERLCATHTLTFAAGLAINWLNGRTQLVTLTGNVTSLTHSNIGAGGRPRLIAVQDATGGRTIVWASTDKFQTAADKIPDDTASSRTEWIGTVVGSDIWWTKLGSWPSGGA
jgi:hypothetical protein